MTGVRLEELTWREFKAHFDCDSEKAIVLAIDPWRVNLSRAADYGHNLDRLADVFHRPRTMNDSRSGAFGDPTLATRAKGGPPWWP